MTQARAALAALLVAPALAACLAPAEAPSPVGIDHEAILRAIGEPVDLLHDHADASLHTGSHAVEFVAWSALDVTLGENGFANFVFWSDDDEDLAFVAIDGDERGGFVVADVSDPRAPRALGRYDVPGTGFQEVRVFPDGRHALLNVQATRVASASRLAALAGEPGACGVCLQVVNVEDRANPTLVSVFPVDSAGSHNMDVVVLGGETYVFYVGQPLVGAPVAAPGNPPVGNYVGAARAVEDAGGLRLVKVGEWRNTDATLDPKRSYPHDVVVREHPFSATPVMYVSHWEGGAITVDARDPTLMRTLAVRKEAAPSEVSNMHWFAPEPSARGERLFAWSAPEIAELTSGSGVVRAYDVTDPAAFEQVGTWTLPGDVTIPGQFLTSPHLTDVDMARGLLAVAHYHAGVWILDATDPTDPRALGYYFPHGDPARPHDGPIWWKKPNFDPAGFLPNAYQARWKDDLLWVTERGTGLYVLRYTGPVPGPLS